MAAFSLEACGFAERGQAPRLALEGEIRPGGRIPISTRGGLKARGHPVGATGVYQLVEVVQQLRGEATASQVEWCPYWYGSEYRRQRFKHHHSYPSNPDKCSSFLRKALQDYRRQTYRISSRGILNSPVGSTEIHQRSGVSFSSGRSKELTCPVYGWQPLGIGLFRRSMMTLDIKPGAGKMTGWENAFGIMQRSSGIKVLSFLLKRFPIFMPYRRITGNLNRIIFSNTRRERLPANANRCLKPF